MDSDKKKNKQTIGTGGAASPHASLVSSFIWWIAEETNVVLLNELFSTSLNVYAKREITANHICNDYRNINPHILKD